MTLIKKGVRHGERAPQRAPSDGFYVLVEKGQTDSRGDHTHVVRVVPIHGDGPCPFKCGAQVKYRELSNSEQDAVDVVQKKSATKFGPAAESKTITTATTETKTPSSPVMDQVQSACKGFYVLVEAGETKWYGDHLHNVRVVPMTSAAAAKQPCPFNCGSEVAYRALSGEEQKAVDKLQRN